MKIHAGRGAGAMFGRDRCGGVPCARCGGARDGRASRTRPFAAAFAVVSRSLWPRPVIPGTLHRRCGGGCTGKRVGYIAPEGRLSWLKVEFMAQLRRFESIGPEMLYINAWSGIDHAGGVISVGDALIS